MIKTLTLDPVYREQRELLNSDVLFVAMTRFNLRMNDEWMKLNYRTPELQEFWLRERIELFRSFCLPAMAGQTIKPHAWIIMLDWEITAPIADLLDEILEYQWIVPMLLPSDWKEVYVQTTREVLARKFKMRHYADVCTIRLDSDDALNRQFVAATDLTIAQLKHEWDATKPRSVTFPRGCRHYNGRFYWQVQPRQFLSLIEPVRGYRTCYRVRHSHVGDIADVADVETGEPMFLYNVHKFGSQSNPKEVAVDDPGATNRRHFIDPASAREMFSLPASATDAPVNR